jgi:hypothetical protein
MICQQIVNKRNLCLMIVLCITPLVSLACGEPAISAVLVDAPSLTLLDSVILSETDSAFVGEPSGFVAPGDGTFLVADRRTATLHHFSADGARIGGVGGRGEGPGEFSSGPGFIALDGDSTIYVEDGGAGVKIFSYADRAFVASRILLGYALPQAAMNGVLYFNHIDQSRHTSVALVRNGEEPIVRGGPFPEPLARNRATAEFFSFMRLAKIGNADTIALAIQSTDYLFLGSFESGPYDSVRVPPIRRRGSQPALLGKVTDDPRTIYPALYQLSVPWALSRLSSGRLAYVATDQELVSQRLVGRLFVSVVDFENRRACVDAEVPGPSDPQPWATFRGDTLLVLVQDVDDGMKPRTVIRKYLLSDDNCNWRSDQ